MGPPPVWRIQYARSRTMRQAIAPRDERRFLLPSPSHGGFYAKHGAPPDKASTTGRRDIGRRHDDAAGSVTLEPRAGFAVACRQMPGELRQARELERGQIFALQMLGQRAAMTREIRTDKELLVLQPDQRLRYREPASEMRHRLERLGIRDVKTRALEHAPPALPGSERGQAEITGMLKRVRPAASQNLAREPGDALAQRGSQRHFLAAEAQRDILCGGQQAELHEAGGRGCRKHQFHVPLSKSCCRNQRLTSAASRTTAGFVGSRGRSNSTTLISSKRPGRGVMMATRSASLIASSMLCVTKMTVWRSRCQIFSSSSCMYSRV